MSSHFTFCSNCRPLDAFFHSGNGIKDKNGKISASEGKPGDFIIPSPLLRRDFFFDCPLWLLNQHVILSSGAKQAQNVPNVKMVLILCPFPK